MKSARVGLLQIITYTGTCTDIGGRDYRDKRCEKHTIWSKTDVINAMNVVINIFIDIPTQM